MDRVGPDVDRLRAPPGRAVRGLERVERAVDDETVVTVCKAGIVARRATSVVEKEGYDAATLAGGMRGWNGYRNGSIGYRLRSALGRLLP